MKNFAYFYFMKKDKSDKIRQFAESHTMYWKGNNLSDYKGGPFADRSGGLIQFKFDSLREAELLIQNDPFIINDVIDQKWLKEWIIVE
jgi:uncharacterized protein YciI